MKAQLKRLAHVNAQLKRLGGAWRRGGPVLALRVAWDRLADAVAERRLRIKSGGLVPIETLVEHWQGFHDYFPSSVRAFRRVLRDLRIAPGDVFVDYGCGMGRALVLAAQFPFDRLVGVEVSDDLLRTAQTNITRAVPLQAQRRIELLHRDARLFELPHDATVLYFYNPFHGETLHAVFADIERSLRAHPRRLRIVFNNPSHFERIEARYGWLRRTREYVYEHKIVVYEASAPGEGGVADI